jgi:BirA family transcriptional regulator, biotin operon repressor / biotin---[acetyl-CoA-carboxylase] ligase
MWLPATAPIVWLAHTTSTQDEARARWNDLDDSAVIAAKHQSAGRGRQGRSWFHAEHGLAFTYLHKPSTPLPMSMATRIPLLAGLALHHALQPLASDVTLGIKWPNDLMRNARAMDAPAPSWRKVGGILVEAVDVIDGCVGGMLVGIGLNLRDPHHPDLGAAGGLWPDTHDVDAQHVLAALQAQLMSHLVRARPPLWTTAHQQVRARCITLGTDVAVDGVAGTAVDIADDGGLVLRTPQGTLTVRAGDALPAHTGVG